MKGKEAVSEEIGDSQQAAPQGAVEKDGGRGMEGAAAFAKSCGRRRGSGEGLAARRLCLLTLQEVTRRHILELMYVVLRRKRSQRRECGGGRVSGRRREEKLKEVIRHASPPCKSDVHI